MSPLIGGLHEFIAQLEEQGIHLVLLPVHGAVIGECPSQYADGAIAQEPLTLHTTFVAEFFRRTPTFGFLLGHVSSFEAQRTLLYFGLLVKIFAVDFISTEPIS